jgi:hypothetical protein
VWKLDRLARSMKQFIETVDILRLRGIGFRSLTEALDTTTTQGRLVFTCSVHWRNSSELDPGAHPSGPCCRAACRVAREAAPKSSQRTTLKRRGHCLPIPTSASPKSHTAWVYPQRRSIGTSRLREPRILLAYEIWEQASCFDAE